MHFWWKITPKWLPFPGVGCYAFGTFFAICSNGRFCYAFRLPIDSLLAPFCSLLAPCGHLLVTIWCNFVNFRSQQDSVFSLWRSPSVNFLFLKYFQWDLIDVQDFSATAYQHIRRRSFHMFAIRPPALQSSYRDSIHGFGIQVIPTSWTR